MTIHPTAIIEDGAQIHKSVDIGAYTWLGARVQIEADVKIAQHVVIDGDTKIDRGCEISPFVTLGGGGNIRNASTPGALRIGACNKIRENVTIHCASHPDMPPTLFGDDNYVMAGCHIAHDCVIGNQNTLTVGTLIGGHCVLGNYINVSGGVQISQKSVIGDYAFIGLGSNIMRAVIPFGMVAQGILRGLNIIGLKRSNFTAEDIRALRAAYSALFETEDLPTIEARLQAYRSAQPIAEKGYVAMLLDFVEANASQLLTLAMHHRRG